MKYAVYPVPILGPCPCQVCGEPLYWARRNTRVLNVVVGSLRWRDWTGRIHKCPVAKPRVARGTRARHSLIAHETAHHSLARARATWDNERVGISDTITDIMCDALLVADTSREGVPRLEVSAPMTFDVR